MMVCASGCGAEGAFQAEDGGLDLTETIRIHYPVLSGSGDGDLRSLMTGTGDRDLRSLRTGRNGALRSDGLLCRRGGIPAAGLQILQGRGIEYEAAILLLCARCGVPAAVLSLRRQSARRGRDARGRLGRGKAQLRRLGKSLL